MGVGLAPFEAYLCLRGIKTMALRIERQQANAEKIARFLAEHPHVTRVNHVGLPSHPGHDLHFRQVRAPSGTRLDCMLSEGMLTKEKHPRAGRVALGARVGTGAVRV